MNHNAMLDAIIHEVMQLEAKGEASIAREDGVRAVLSRFAANLVGAVLPEDPIAQQAIMRKAQGLGIDIGAQSGQDVAHHVSSIAELTSDQLAALNEIGEHLDALILEAPAAHLEKLATQLENVRAEAAP